ncbi:serine/threonine-protein kinase [Frondihabitans sp. PhB188]|uniref:Stk1 family PASTA domain-containing Ser/Thr kinase n=1 Tax=Frondihabitans sp. PhB188 TaxID=2485200 RepID=UPI000F4A0B5C|nr:Stk1 family PASTA domain-containing Ser/Thr kinase [Frondihabitans sp. PhB188]ROQ37105.1 serine/threonine-protein kinase [Frondihabitans sp. PhB188]
MAEGVTEGISLLANRYQIGHLIGHGGMANVYMGTDSRLGRQVAIKLMKSQLASDPAFRTRFRQEAQAAARMAHPTIVRVFDAGEESVRDAMGNQVLVPYIVMEYVEGRLLKDIVAEGPLDPKEAVRITEGVLTALEYSHRAGVVHRDIKPGNVMLTHTGQVKVMDFGIARAVSDSAATVAQTTAILGTAQYFSPEQARGETVDARSDLYSTGVLLFELLTGRPPFRGESPVAVAYQHVSEPPVPPSVLNPAISPALDAVTLHALAKSRFDRFQSAAEFRSDVVDAGSGNLPARRQQHVTVAAADTTTTMFGVNPNAAMGSEAALKELNSSEANRPARTQTRPPVAWIWAGIVLIAIIVIAVVIWVARLSPVVLPSTAGIDVPTVASEPYKTGAAKLTKLGLVPERSDITSESVDEGDIVKTSPPAGTPVAKDEIITVYVSTGPDTVAMPDVSGSPTADAWDQLTTLGLQQGSVSEQDSPTVAAGTVISSTPEPGTSVEPGSTVDLVVSSGTVNVPDVTEKSVADAMSALSSLGLDVRTTADDSCTGNIVSTQSLPVGEQPQGSTITLTVCSGQ